ncbi:MAG: porin [Rhizobiales bacterium]|nr:porin [Hyphomicrobiales bacterium]
MTSRLSLAALIAGGMMVATSSANAADLGGDCCADLEERVATLEATTARKGNRKVSLKIYGQVNQALLIWDDGQDSDAYVVDNDSSASRIGFKGKAKINNDWSAGYRIEIGVYSAESDRVDQGNDDGDGNRLDLRRSEMFIKSKTFGKVTWGLTSTALDGTTKADLSGTHVVARNGGLRYIEDFFIINSATGASTGTRWGKIFDGDTELDRDNVIRYETPTVAGFKVSASWGEDDQWSVAAFYKAKFDQFKIKAAIGYGEEQEDLGDASEHFNGSASIMHTPTGIFVTGSAGEREFKSDGDVETFYQIKAGIQQKWNSLGKTTLYGEYVHGDTDDTGEGDIYGFGVVQKVDAAAMELYAGFRHYEADLDTGVDTEDFITVVTGARIKF